MVSDIDLAYCRNWRRVAKVYSNGGVTSLFRRLGAAALDLMLPPRCPACGTIVDAPDTFCAPCWSTLDFIGAPLCPQCGAPFPHAVAEGLRCGACLAQPPPWSAARAAWRYSDAAARAILAFKHADRPELAAAFAIHLARAGRALLTNTETLIAPVPLHRWRLWRRGYNQSALLALALARRTGHRPCLDLLTRHKATASQQGLSRPARERNVSGAFRVTARRRQDLAGRSVLLVDDVLTTGATAQACAKALLRAGARDVQLLTLARVLQKQ